MRPPRRTVSSGTYAVLSPEARAAIHRGPAVTEHLPTFDKLLSQFGIELAGSADSALRAAIGEVARTSYLAGTEREASLESAIELLKAMLAEARGQGR